jgi:hypothetical protein
LNLELVVVVVWWTEKDTAHAALGDKWIGTLRRLHGDALAAVEFIELRSKDSRRGLCLAHPQRAVCSNLEECGAGLALKLDKVAGGFFEHQTGEFEKRVGLGAGFDLLEQTIDTTRLGTNLISQPSRNTGRAAGSASRRPVLGRSSRRGPELLPGGRFSPKARWRFFSKSSFEGRRCGRSLFGRFLSQRPSPSSRSKPERNRSADSSSPREEGMEIFCDEDDSLTHEGWKDLRRSISRPDRSVGFSGLVFIDRLMWQQSG